MAVPTATINRANKKDKALLPSEISNHWKGKLSQVSYGREELRFWWLGPKGKVALDSWVESFTFDDTSDQAPVLTGAATLRQSLVHTPIPPIDSGDEIVVEMRDGPSGSWSEFTRLRVEEPQRLASGQFTFQLANDAALLALGTDSWHFPHNKAHKHGWYPWQIVEEVGKRTGVHIVMPKLGKRIKKFKPMLTSSPIDVINAAMQHIRVQDRKTLVRRFEAGTLYLTERRYSPELMTLGPQLIEASLTSTKRDGWATALTVRTTAEVARGSSGGMNMVTHKGIVVAVRSPAFQKRFGYVHMVVYAHGAKSVAEVKEMGRQHLVRVLQPKRNLTLTTPLIRGLRRGAYVRLAVPTLGLTQIVFVSGVRYSLSPGSFTMDVTVGFEDPVITPPIDNVNLSTRNLKKKKNLTVNSTKTDKKTSQPRPAAPTLGGIATP